MKYKGGLFHGRWTCEFCGATFGFHCMYDDIIENPYCPKCGKRTEEEK